MKRKKKIKTAFKLQSVSLPLSSLVETRPLLEARNRQVCYDSVKASIKESGLVQPLVVCPAKGSTGSYRILDGHLRLYALQDLGYKEAFCIISTDDERYTFDAQVNYINPIQSHKMIQQAVKKGLKPERIAAALNIDLKKITGEMKLLDGIHAEAVNILKDKPIKAGALKTLRRVKPIRQIEMAENMCAVNNFTEKYTLALLAATRADQMVSGKKATQISGINAETLARMEKEMESLDSDFEQLEEAYSKDIYSLTVIQGYIKRLLSNKRICRFLQKNNPDMFTELETIAEMDSLTP